MAPIDTPLSYGVRQAIKESPRTTYEIAKLSGVSAQNLYRFLDEVHPRTLSQKSLDKLGLTLKLSVTLDYDGLRPVHLEPYRRGLDLFTGRDIDKKINEIPDSPLSLRIRRAVEMHRRSVTEFAGDLEVTKTQMYRFLDGTRGLSLAKLDALCDILDLFVEGPYVHIFPRKQGGMITGKRRIYQPNPAAQPKTVVAEKSQPSPPVRPASHYSPPDGNAEGDN
jgi:transcriptional regulator with XRE-family HTH domain